jgi:hypothetical protein
MQDKFNDIKEGHYASHLKEPLGKGFSRDYNWPDKIPNTGSYPFGVPTNGLENAKEILYPKNGKMREDDPIHAMYR